MKCEVHDGKELTHYSTSMREFVCTDCLKEVVNELSPSKMDRNQVADEEHEIVKKHQRDTLLFSRPVAEAIKFLKNNVNL
jgi:hypothetical protein